MKNFLKYTTVVITVVFSILACETDFENIGNDLVDNDTFDANKVTYEVTAFTKNVEKSRVENRPLNALGVYNDVNFGYFKAGIATQLGLPADGVNFGLEPTIDAVILDIPYNASSDGKYDDDKPKFKLNNIYGNQEVAFNLKVSQLSNYLNSLDPLDPTKPKKYYSNRTFNKLTELFNDNFQPNKNDTVLYVRRVDFDTDELEDFDTIKKENSFPSIKLPLDQSFFNTNFLENTDSDNFESQEKFTLFLNGLLFEAEGADGSAMMLDMNEATLNIYYSNYVLKNETVSGVSTDLNGNGVIDPDPVEIRTKQTMTFGFKATPTYRIIRTSTFERDYSMGAINSVLNNPSENKKLYIQGAQGSIASLDLFSNIDATELENIRSKNWLINEASLVLNIDQVSGDTVPSRLFLYKLDENNDDENENAQVLDIMTEGEAVYDGKLQSETTGTGDDTVTTRVKYRFRITDYFSELLKNEDPTQAPVKFGIKAFHITDLPNVQNQLDTIVKNFSWDPKGVVIYGNDYQPEDVDYNKRLKLELYYTELNN